MSNSTGRFVLEKKYAREVFNFSNLLCHIIVAE